MPGIGSQYTTPQPKKKVRVRKPKPTRVSSPDSVDRNATAKKQAATRKAVRKNKVTPVPSPDAKDSTRPVAQKKRDAVVVAQNIKVSRAKAFDKQKSVDDAGPVKLLPQYAKSRAAKKAQVASRVAPVLKVLDQTTRPLHAIAAGTDAAIQHRNVPKAALEGLKNKDKTTFSTVLKHAGVKNKYVRGAAGFALDVGLDPTTYLTGGTASVARKAATEGAEKAAAKGIVVKMAGKEVPGVRKATAKAGEGGGKAFRKVVPERVRNATRDAASEVNPNVAPSGVDKATHEASRRIARKERASTGQGDREAINLAHGIKSKIGPANYARVTDALEAEGAKRPTRQVSKTVKETVSRKVPATAEEHAIAERALARNRAKKQRQAKARQGRTERKQASKHAAAYDPTPEGIAAKTFYHGTGTKGLSTNHLDSSQTSIENLYGQGVYLTSKPGIARGYSKARGRKTSTPTIYKARVKPKGVLDLEAKADPKFVKVLEKHAENMGYVPYEGVTPEILDAVRAAASKSGATNKSVFDALRRAASEHSHTYEKSTGSYHENFQDLTGDLRAAGWDTLTHIGGERTGRKPHQVVIALDPSDTMGHGLPSPIHGFDERIGSRTRPQRESRATVGDLGRTTKQRVKRTVTETVKDKRTGTVESLPPELRGHAETLRGALAAVQAKQRAAGLKVRDRKGYVPHKLTPQAIKDENKKAARVGGKGTATPFSSKARKDQRTMAELRTAEPGRYRQDLHATVAERMAEGTASAARATLAKDLADLGREIPRGSKPHLTEHEAIYKLKDGQLTEVNPHGKAFQKKPPADKPLKAKYVVLNRGLVERTMGSAGSPKGGTLMHGYDKAQGGFKRVALATPGFHIRNAIGDTAQAYVHQPGQKLPGNMVRAGRVLKAAGRIEKNQRALGTRPSMGAGSLKTKRYGHVSYEEAAQKLIDAGAARSGYTSRELRELASSGSKTLKLPKSPAGVRRAFLNREDLPRLATAIHALREGATYEEAAAKVAGAHFDYADLTPFERNVARRIMPFYTWTARNVPLQAKRLVTNPGKFAAYQKVRENAAQLSQPDEIDPKTQALYKQLEAAGVKLPGGWEKYLTAYEQRNAGVPVSWKGHKFTVSAGLPLTDLNELPGMSGPGEYANKAMSLVTPIVKDPLEFLYNYSFFFRDQIERDNSPLVAAPSFVNKWPDSAKRKFGVVKALDKRAKKPGTMIWQWPGKADYVAHAVPGLPSTVVKMMTPGHDQQGKGTAAKALGIAGIKAAPVDAQTNAINMAYARGQEIQKRQTVLRKQNNPANGRLISAKNPTPEYTRLALQLRTVNTIAYQGKDARGDAVLPTQGGPKKGRSNNGRVRVPGVSGRVKLPGVGGRVKVP